MPKCNLMRCDEIKKIVSIVLNLEKQNNNSWNYEYILSPCEKNLLFLLESTSFTKYFSDFKNYLINDGTCKNVDYKAIAKSRTSNKKLNTKLEGLITAIKEMYYTRLSKYKVLDYDYSFFIRLIDTTKKNEMRSITINQIYNEDYNNFIHIAGCSQLDIFKSYYVTKNKVWIDESRHYKYLLYQQETLFIKLFHITKGYIQIKPKQMEFELFV